MLTFILWSVSTPDASAALPWVIHPPSVVALVDAALILAVIVFLWRKSRTAADDPIDRAEYHRIRGAQEELAGEFRQVVARVEGLASAQREKARIDLENWQSLTEVSVAQLEALNKKNAAVETLLREVRFQNKELKARPCLAGAGVCPEGHEPNDDGGDDGAA